MAKMAKYFNYIVSFSDTHKENFISFYMQFVSASYTIVLINQGVGEASL